MITQPQTTSPTPDSTAPPVRPVPFWASAMVILVSLALGAAFVWWFVFGSSPGRTRIVFDAPPPPSFRGGGGPGPSPAMQAAVRRMLDAAPPGVYAVGEGEWSVRTPSTVTRVVRREGDRFAFHVNYRDRAGLPQEHVQLLRARAQLLRDEKAAEAIELTASQRERLETIDGNLAAPLTSDDRARLTALMADYVANGNSVPQSPPARALADATEAIAKSRADATAAAVAEAAGAVQSVLTAEQIQKLRSQ